MHRPTVAALQSRKILMEAVEMTFNVALPGNELDVVSSFVHYVTIQSVVYYYSVGVRVLVSKFSLS